jgi:hypothetical protein
VIEEAALWLSALAPAEWVRKSAYAYPVLEALHITGIALLVGALALVDLRLAGFWRALPLEPLARAALPLAGRGFVLAAASGALMAIAGATELAHNRAFQLKLLLLALALVNALAFHRRRSLMRADATARVQALLSLVLWIALIFAGRFIAYV